MFGSRSAVVQLVLAAFFGFTACASNQQAKDRENLGQTEITTDSEEVQRQVVVTQQAEVPTVRHTVERADINRMKEEHFMFIGFPKETAREIVRYREKHGQFNSIDDLRNVNGVNQAMIDRLYDRLSLSSLD